MLKHTIFYKAHQRNGCSLSYHLSGEEWLNDRGARQKACSSDFFYAKVLLHEYLARLLHLILYILRAKNCTNICVQLWKIKDQPAWFQPWHVLVATQSIYHQYQSWPCHIHTCSDYATDMKLNQCRSCLTKVMPVKPAWITWAPKEGGQGAVDIQLLPSAPPHPFTGARSPIFWAARRRPLPQHTPHREHSLSS